MNAFNYILFILFIFGFGCSHIQKNVNPYDDVLSRVPEDLRVFFPNSVDANWAQIAFNEIPYFDEHRSKTTFYYLEAKVNNFESVIPQLYDSSIAVYKFSDKCNIVVNKFQSDDGFASSFGREWLYDNWIESIDTCSFHVPIPNFCGLEPPDFIRDEGLSDEYDILVTQFADSVVLSERYYGPPTIMPHQWKRGHSYGVCIQAHAQKIIWWLVIW